MGTYESESDRFSSYWTAGSFVSCREKREEGDGGERRSKHGTVKCDHEGGLGCVGKGYLEMKRIRGSAHDQWRTLGEEWGMGREFRAKEEEETVGEE